MWYHMVMTFRHTLYLSIAAHILVFGSAIAFARYGSGLLLMSPGSIQVALVSPDSPLGAGSNTAPARNRSALPQTEHPAEEQSVEKLKETPVEEGMARENVPIPEERAEQQNGYGVRADARTAGSKQGTGQDETDGFGLVSSGEWEALAAAIERTKSYPRIARERGIEGEVRLRFRLAPSGSVEKIEILQSSGYEVLDKASIGAVYRAEPLPYVNGWVEMPMRYVLKR